MWGRSIPVLGGALSSQSAEYAIEVREVFVTGLRGNLANRIVRRMDQLAGVGNPHLVQELAEILSSAFEHVPAETCFAHARLT